MGTNPVALDYTGWQIIEQKRAEKGLEPLRRLKLKNLPPTPISTLERAKAIADGEGLRFVHIGNVPGHPAESTYCPKCRQVVVQRNGFVSVQVLLEKGKCRHCQTPIAGVWRAS